MRSRKVWCVQMDEVLRTAGDIGRLIKAERKRQKVSQVELADFSNVGITFLSQLENGKQTAEVGKVLRVLQTLGIDVVGRGRS